MNYKSQVVVSPFLRPPSLLVVPAPFSFPLSRPKIIERNREDCNSRQALRHWEGHFEIIDAGEVPKLVK